MITNFEDWTVRYRLNRERDPFKIAPLAVGLMFDWCVTGASVDVEPSVIVAQFGDGYAQRRAAGVNNKTQVWNLEMRNAQEVRVRGAYDFLAARGGYEIFNWTEPRTENVLSVICPSWSLAYGDLLDSGERLFIVSMRFEQAFV